MNKVIIVLVAVVMTACGTTDEVIGQDKEQAIRDFIAVRQLPEVDKIRTASQDSFKEIDAWFVIYKTRKDAYLFEFARACYELINDEIVADQRWGGNTIRARFDTLRGCRINQIYALTEAELVELEDIGESPGSRN